MNILIVDDNAESRYLLESLLKGSGHDVRPASNGVEALEVLAAGGIDLVVSDILMPVMDGFQLCRKVKTDQDLRVIPFVFHTATYTDPQDETFALKIGADRFVEKPCEPERFMAIVDEVMAVSKERAAFSASPPVEEEEALKLYSERLVRKLEQKVLEAEREIAARQEAEASLRESEARLIAAQRLAGMGDFTWDVETGEIRCSEALFDLLGYDKADTIDYAQVNAKIHHPDDLAGVSSWLETHLASGREELPPKEYRVIRRDGEVLFVRTVGRIQKRTERQPVVFATVYDITQRRQAEEALRESSELLNGILNSIPVRVFWKDRNLVYQGCNMPFARDAGFEKPEDLIGKNDLAMGWREEAELYRADDRAVIERGEAKLLFEESQTTPSGERIHLLTSKIPLRDAAGKIVGVLGIYQDITDFKRGEEQRATLLAQLQQAQKMESVGRLAGGVAHDYNNMLSVILGYTELIMARVGPSEPLHDDLQEILKATKRSIDITRQLLAFARKQTIAPRVLDLNETIESMLKMLRHLIGEDIDLLWRPGKKCRPVRMDPSQIDQILANLCVNARDAIVGVGKVTIETDDVTLDGAYCADHADVVPGEFAKLSVSDDGCGMDKDILDRIFEPFFTTKEVGRGTGLGLATVYGIVKQNSGFINVYSEKGQGTTFNIYLPHDADRVERIETPDAADIPTGRSETVLLVEDEAALLKLGKTMLEQLGYTVLPAATPGEAMRLADTHTGRIHLLLTDVVMPEMNGRELAERLSTIHPDVRPVFMSGYPASMIAQKGVLDEGVCLIQKPLSMKDLAVKVRQTLDLK